MENKLFISYSHKDTEAVSKISEIIENKVDCILWFDKNLHGGEEYFSIIADKILECDQFIFVVSPNSVCSDWCIKELEFAMSEGKKIIAIWLEDFLPPPRVRLVISNTHYLKNYELSDDAFARSMADALDSAYYSLFRGEAENKLSEMQSESEKYFISPKEKEKINTLLKAEESQDYLTCFEADNAVLLGLAYEMGSGIEKSNIKADFYYHIAAYKGNMDGEYLMLALGLANGTVEKVPTIERMNELAEAGCMKAMIYWGDEVYLGNWNMALDKPKAYKWFRQAADKGDPVAKYFLGYGYKSGDIGKTDYVIAWMYFHEAAQQHFPRAYRQIAFMYQRGQLVKEDKETARLYFKKAIDSGDIFTENFLGNLEYNEKNYGAAFECYTRAINYVREKNLPKSSPFYNLGWSYEFGEGVEQSKEKAIELYLEGAQLGNKNCKKRVVRLINSLDNKNQTIEYLKTAVEYDCQRAEYSLGMIYEKQTDGSYKQNETSLDYFEAGANKGCFDCIESLMSYYSWVFGAKRFKNREKAISNFSLFFSLLDHADNKEILESRKEDSSLHQIYYVYGLELDIDEEGGNPDKQMALYYYKKCLESESAHKYWHKVADIGIMFARITSHSIFYNDVSHSEEIIDLCYDFFDKTFSDSTHEEQIKNIDLLIDAYNLIERNYSYDDSFENVKMEKIAKCKNRLLVLLSKKRA